MHEIKISTQLQMNHKSKCKMCETLRRKHKRKSLWSEFRKEFLDLKTKAHPQEEKNCLKTFSVKDTINRMKRQATILKKTLANHNHISDRRLVSRIYTILRTKQQGNNPI